MGGPGSGKYWRRGARATTVDYRMLDVRHFAREDALRPGYEVLWVWTRDGDPVASTQMSAQQGRLVLVYRHRRPGDAWKDEQQDVRIVRTPCHLGGSRVWFICPTPGCGRRVAILYGRGAFACRHCHRLVYPSCREEAGDRAARCADRLRLRLGWSPGILNRGGGKPKWMRWPTYWRLTIKHDELVARALRALSLRLRCSPSDSQASSTDAAGNRA